MLRAYAAAGTAALALAALAGCGDEAKNTVAQGSGRNPDLPQPNTSFIPTINIAPAKGWPAGGKPQAAPGLAVAAYADGLDHPRWLYVLPNGDVLVAESNAPERPDDSTGIVNRVAGWVKGRAGAGVPSADRITLLRDQDGDGTPDTRSAFIEHLHSPFGMALVGDTLYVANADELVSFPYAEGQTRIDAPPRSVTHLPGGPINHHWTKNVIASPDGQHLYVTVGSNSNVGENGLTAEFERAAIWEVDPRTGMHRVFAGGIRNPNGMGWQPQSGALWTVANERDELGSDLVPDYLTSVKDGAFYGWPFSYYGQHVDTRPEPANPGLVEKAIAPDYAVGPHTATLGLAFVTPENGRAMSPELQNGAFIGQHGSWNRKPLSGYKVAYVPFANGEPSGEMRDVLTGFVSPEGDALGRPVGVVMDKGGALLVADDVGNRVWRVSAAGSARTASAQ